MPSTSPPLTFRPIDLERHANLCVRFREDSFVVSFGDTRGFHGEDGEGSKRYLAWLRECLREHPGGQVHAWSGAEIIGQLEMRPLPEEPDVGYVDLVYLAPAWRGRGLAAALDGYAISWLRDRGCRIARLAVSETNLRAIRFYCRQGWVDAGPRPKRPIERRMERSL